MNLSHVEDRLKGIGLHTIGSVLSLSEIATKPGRLPSAYVMPESESSPGGTMYGSGVHDQDITEIFGVIITVSAAAVQAGAKEDALGQLRRAVRDRLMGWQHPEASGPTDYLGGRTLSASGGAATYVLRFRAVEHVRMNPE